MTTRYNSQPGHITLMNGPGEGNRFHVQRAPILLRVVSDLNNGWDVLDQLEDTPLPEEEIHVYKQMGWMHVRGNNRKDSGVYYDYAHVPILNTLKATLRYTQRWQEWAEVQALELTREAS